MLTNDIVVVGK